MQAHETSTRKRKCKHCQTFFDPDPRSVKRQRYCCQARVPPGQQGCQPTPLAQQPHNRDYFTGPTHVERVRQWRRAHPGYWRRQRSRTPDALQEDLTRKRHKHNA